MLLLRTNNITYLKVAFFPEGELSFIFRDLYVFNY